MKVKTMKFTQGPWPLLIIMLMFFVLPLSTIPGLFDLVFIVLAGFTVVLIGLLVASVVAGLRAAK